MIKYYKILIGGKKYKVFQLGGLYRIARDTWSKPILLGTKNVVHLFLDRDNIIVEVKMLDKYNRPRWISLQDICCTSGINSPGGSRANRRKRQRRDVSLTDQLNGVSHCNKIGQCKTYLQQRQEVYKFRIKLKQDTYIIPISSLDDSRGFIHQNNRFLVKNRIYNLKACTCRFQQWKHGDDSIGRIWYKTKGKPLIFKR